MTESQTDLDHNRAWLKAMRDRLGWTTGETAQQACQTAKTFNDDLNLSQQAVSAFEKGKHKSTPRWLGYVLVAMRHAMAVRHIDDRDLEDVRFPPSMAAYFLVSKPLHDTSSVDDRTGSASERRQSFGSFPARTSEDFARDNGLMPIRQIDLAFGMGATYLDVPVEEETLLFPMQWVRQFTKAPASKLFFAQGTGDSMQPTLFPNDTLIIDCSQLVLNMADQIWAVTYCGMGMIKRLRPTKDGGIRIMSDNPSVPEEVAHDGELQLVGRVVAVTRKI